MSNGCFNKLPSSGTVCTRRCIGDYGVREHLRVKRGFTLLECALDLKKRLMLVFMGRCLRNLRY